MVKGPTAVDNDIVGHLMDIKQAQARTETKVDALNEELLGRGNQPGLRSRVDDLEGSKRYMLGFGAAITALGAAVEFVIHFMFKTGKLP